VSPLGQVSQQAAPKAFLPFITADIFIQSFILSTTQPMLLCPSSLLGHAGLLLAPLLDVVLETF